MKNFNDTGTPTPQPSGSGTPALLPTDPSNRKRSRIQNAIDAATTVEQLIWAQRERARKWAQWLGMFQGNPPYSPNDLRNLGRRWQNNFNPRTASGILSTACTPYYDLFEAGPVHATIRLKDREAPPQVMRERSRTATEEWHELLDTEGWLSDAFYRLCWSFVGFGKGYFFWPDPYRWKPKVKLWYEVLHPERQETDPTAWELAVVRINMGVAELFQYISDAKAATEAGWNVPVVRETIKRAMPVRKESSQDWLLYQQELHDHALTTSSRLAAVQLAYVYAREWDGRWTLGILPRHVAQREAVPTEYLFFKQGVAESLDDLLVPFYYDPTEGSVQGVEGLASMLYGAIRNMDRLTCTIADGGHLRALPILTPASASAQAKGGVTIQGGCAIVPVGFNIQNGQVLADMEGPISAHRHLFDTAQQNVGVYMPKAERPVGNPDTATQVAARQGAQTQLTASGVKRFYGSLDKVLETMFRRTLRVLDDPAEHEEKRAAKEFVAACKARGVTLAMLKEHYPTKAYRVVGAGGAMAKQSALWTLFPIAGGMPSSGKQAYLDQLVSAVAGPTQVREFFPLDGDTPDMGDWEANVENTQANQGSPPIFTPNQDHLSHLQGHLQALTAGLQAVEQGADPNGVYAFCAIMISHTAQHLAAAENDPTAKQHLPQLKQALKTVEQNAQRLVPMIQQMQEQQALQQQAQQVQAGMDPKVQLQAAKAQAQMQLKGQKQQADLALAATRQENEMTMSNAAHLQEMRQLEEKHRVDASIKVRQANAKTAQTSKG